MKHFQEGLDSARRSGKGALVIVAGVGILSMAAAFYLFVNLWPQEVEPTAEELKARAESRRPKPKPLSPEEYRRQRAQAQKLIRDKAAPALAKAVRGILRQDESKRKRDWKKNSGG